MNTEETRLPFFFSEMKEVVKRIMAWMLLTSRVLLLGNWVINRFQGCVNAAGEITFPFIQKRRSRNLQILTYHRVNEESDPFFPALAPVVFERHMEYLASHFY